MMVSAFFKDPRLHYALQYTPSSLDQRLDHLTHYIVLKKRFDVWSLVNHHMSDENLSYIGSVDKCDERKRSDVMIRACLNDVDFHVCLVNI